jgi:NADPH-dependent 2,4-dienoyl-CoA reductase/sulfur reductase-like enzyme
MRAHSPGVVPAVERVSIRYRDQPIVGRPGDTVASALIAADERTCRETESGERRGLFCGMGVCAECTVVVDGVPGALACLTPVRDGMTVDVQPARPALHPPSASHGLPEQELSPDVLVIGGGPAGLVAAAIAAEAGLDVVVVDERRKLGGQYFKQPGAGHRIDETALDRQYQQGRALIERVGRSGARVLSGARVWGAFGPHHVVASGETERWTLRPRQLVLATGAYERGVPTPGWTLPGVMTTGAAQTLLRSNQVSPGSRVLVSGNGPLNLQVAAELARAGVHVVAVAELGRPFHPRHAAAGARMLRTAPTLVADGLRYITILARRRVPRLWQAAVIRCDGDTAVRSATVARIDAGGRPVAGTERRFEVDAVCLGFGFLPSNEIAGALGCEHVVNRGGLEVVRDDDGRTSIADTWAIGDSAASLGAKVALAMGARCGTALVAQLGGTSSPILAGERERAIREHARQLRFQAALRQAYTAPELSYRLADSDTIVCRCESVTAGDLQRDLATTVQSAGALKRVTRAGMGKCQGRYCGPVLIALASEHSGQPIDPYSGFLSQVPFKPTSIATIAAGSDPVSSDPSTT